MPSLTSTAIVKRLAPYIVLTVGLSISMFILLHNLGHDYIAPWDEVVHVNVAHNLYADCCDPKLHTIDLGTREQWTNSYIWLHKPLFPFYLRASLYCLLGESLFVFRLPSAFFAILTAVSLFFVASRLSNAWVAIGTALLFASNQYVFQLVQGHIFSDLSELMNVFFLTIVLGLTLGSATGRPLLFRDSTSSVAYELAALVAALLAALAYSCKGGLASPGIVVFAVALIWQRGRRSVRPIILMSLLFSALVFVESFYFSHRFPHEFYFEQRKQISHLFTDVEGWARPWDFYINVSWPDMLGVPLSVLGFLAMMACLLPKLRNRRNLLLALWVMIYLVPLSFGVSKISNFLSPILPAVILLIGFSAYDLFHCDRLMFLYSLTGILFLFIVFYCLNILQFGYYVDSLADGYRHPFLVLAVSAGILLLSLFLSALEQRPGTVPLPSVFPHMAMAMAALMCVTVVIRHSYNDWYLSNILPLEYQEEMALKATASAIRGHMPQGAVVLVDKGHMFNGHLYFQYWSGVNSLPAEEWEFAVQTLSSTHPLYLLVEDPGYTPPNGNPPHWSLSKIH